MTSIVIAHYFTCTSTNEKWIVDFGALKYMASKLNLLTRFHKLYESREGEVHLPTGGHSRLSNVGSFAYFFSLSTIYYQCQN